MAALACAASMFAVDISSTVKMDTTIVGNNGDDIEFFKVNKKDQKDSDALIFSANTEKAGGQFQLWYKFDGTDTTKPDVDIEKQEVSVNGLNVRNVNLWFKPIDSLKVTVGNVNLDSYKEQIFWWHGVYGEKPGSWGAFGGEYIAGVGAKVEFNPIENLALTFAFMPGIDTPWISTAKDSKIKNYAVKAKYSNIADMPISATVVFADKGDNKIIGIGADYSANGLYAFLNANINLNDDGFAAISFDNYEKYAKDAFTVQAHLPVSIFKDGDDMKVGMHATVKGSYALDGCTPYLLISNEPDGDAGWVFDDNLKFKMTFQPGVTFNVGAAGFDIAARIDVDAANEKQPVNWKVPCAITVGL